MRGGFWEPPVGEARVAGFAATAADLWRQNPRRTALR
jgi:hypothetical protein